MIEFDLNTIDIYSFDESEYFKELPEIRQQIAYEIVDYVPVHEIAKKHGFNLSRFYTWRKEYPYYHYFLKRLVNMRGSLGKDTIIIFRGFPEDSKEVQRRATIVRYLFSL